MNPHSIKNPAKSFPKIQALLEQVQARPLRVIALTGTLSALAYLLFIMLPFFIPYTDRSHFPPYLALPEGGFSISSYYGLYAFILFNALVIFGLYLVALRAAARLEETRTAQPAAPAEQPGARWFSSPRLIIYFSVLFHLLMLATPFLLSTDIFDYIRHGRILAFHGENPLLVPATYFPEDPFFGLGGWVGTGSVYGSLHVYLMAALARLAGDGFAANFFLFRGFFVALNVVNVVLIWRLASRLKPGAGGMAAAFYGWNPFVLTLVVAGAHNDILMLTLVLAGFALHLERRTTLAIVMLALATLVKFIAFPILLVYLALMLRERRAYRHGLAAALAAPLVCAAIFVVSYVPLWAGRDTFGYMTTVGQKTNFTISALIMDAAATHVDFSLLTTLVQFTLAALLGAYLVWHLLGVRDTWSLLSAAAGLAFLTPLVLFWFQPWYLTLALGILALRPHRLMFVAALAFSFSVMFFDSFWWHAPVSMNVQKPLRVLVVFGPPLLLLAALKMKESLPTLWQSTIRWSLAQAGGERGQESNLRDPSGARLAGEIGTLTAAALVPMLAVIFASPQLRGLAELLLLKLRLLIF